MFFYVAVIFAHKYHIKLHQEELYLHGQTNSYEIPTMGSFETKNTFQVEITPKVTTKKIINVEEVKGNVLDMADNANPLIYYPKHYGANQQFEIVPYNLENAYYIMNLEKCLTWIPKDLVLRVEECKKDEENQLFEFVCTDCPEVAESEQNNNDVITVEHFLNNDTVVLINNIESMVAQLSGCFISNGTCEALDDETKTLFCYSPYQKIPQAFELWPDFKSKDISDSSIKALGMKL